MPKFQKKTYFLLTYNYFKSAVTVFSSNLSFFVILWCFDFCCCHFSMNTLATWCKDLTHLKRPWYWERLKAGGEGDDRGWDGWMASLTPGTWVWVNSGSWWWTGKPGMLQVHGVTKSWTWLSNWTELISVWSSLHSCWVRGKIYWRILH